MVPRDHHRLTNCQVPQDRPDPGLSREDQLYEAAIALSLGDGIPFTARDYQLLELLCRIAP